MLLPDPDHCVIEGGDVFGAFFEGCSFGDVFHTAKVGKMVWGGKDGTRSRKLWESGKYLFEIKLCRNVNDEY